VKPEKFGYFTEGGGKEGKPTSRVNSQTKRGKEGGEETWTSFQATKKRVNASLSCGEKGEKGGGKILVH